jgi:hypothetical protein
MAVDGDKEVTMEVDGDKGVTSSIRGRPTLTETAPLEAGTDSNVPFDSTFDIMVSGGYSSYPRANNNVSLASTSEYN